jgi:hypothetical protein
VNIRVEFDLCSAVGAGAYAGFLDIRICQPLLYGALKIKLDDIRSPRAAAVDCFDVPAMIANQLTAARGRTAGQTRSYSQGKRCSFCGICASAI